MTRRVRLAILGGTALLLVAGTAFATQSPHHGPNGPAAASQQPESPPSADELAHALDRLQAAGIDTTTDQLSQLAGTYGLGGAVRLLEWSDASGMSVADLQALRDDGKGWGQIAHDLDLNPGIGTVMGQGGDHGHSADGHGKPSDAGADGDDAESPEESPAD